MGVCVDEGAYIQTCMKVCVHVNIQMRMKHRSGR